MNHSEIFLISLFSIVQIWVESIFFLQFLVDILPLGSGLVDPDPGSQNLVDPTDPDPMHWPDQSITCFILVKITLNSISSNSTMKRLQLRRVLSDSDKLNSTYLIILSFKALRAPSLEKIFG